MSNILKGKPVSESIDLDLQVRVAKLKEKGIIPTLAIIRVGEKPDDISYEKGATKKASNIGIDVKSVVLPIDVSYDEFYKKLNELNNDDTVHGILMCRPLPKDLDNELARISINPEKDIDGCSNASLAGVFTNTKCGFAPCTAEAAVAMLDYYKIDVTGKNVVVLGRSLVIGKPVAMLLLNKNATVTICHTKTKDTAAICKDADIVIAATGVMESLNKDYFSSKQTVIDVGISYNDVKQKLCGDVLFEEVEPIVENITPVPGGVGSVTTSILCKHVVEACEAK